MKIALEKVEPAQIEKRSFEIIGEELGERSFRNCTSRSLKDVSTQVQILITQRIWYFRTAPWIVRWKP